MAEKLFPYQQSIPVAFLIGKGLLTGLEGALNPQVKNEAEQLKRMYAEMGDDHKERVMAQAKGGRVLKQAVIQIYKEWQAQQARKPAPPIMGVRASLADTTDSDIA